MARYWPELPSIFDLDSATLLRTIEEYGGPEAVAKQSAEALQNMTRIGGASLSMEKCRQAVESAKTTTGVPMLDAECESLKELAKEILRNRDAARRVKADIECSVSNNVQMVPLGDAVGKVTAAVLFVELGDPSNYDCAAAYLKAAGLNLKERSSGKHQGKLKITKRGSSVVRRYLYLATLRFIYRCPVCRAWYLKKVARDGGKHKMLGVIGVMRKLTKALWHVGQGEEFDPTKLFDISRLKLVL
jgi:transposase